MLRTITRILAGGLVLMALAFAGVGIATQSTNDGVERSAQDFHRNVGQTDFSWGRAGDVDFSWGARGGSNFHFV